MPEKEAPEPGFDAPEHDMLTGYLDYHRATLVWKCAGLSDEQMRERPLPPSGMSLLGLVRHLAEVERWWFRRVFAREQLDDIYCTEDNPDGDWDDTADADVTADWATWRDECDRARAIVAGASGLDEKGYFESRRDPRSPLEPSLRWILTHMLEEYARHNGHADVIRERIDGQTGD